ncbi:MAG: purine-binding chemotaxis protein CheW [Gammaproteobacteria bacterium]|nr:purine-binding chemotaxis protein CheW [Gammaproteobacteria bacterium]
MEQRFNQLINRTEAQLDLDEELGLNQTAQYLIFTLGGKKFALDILSMQEIRRGNVITEVPNTPVHVAGVINLRGLIVPVIDLRQLFEIKGETLQKKPAVIVTKTIQNGAEKVVGLMVDAVTDVFKLSTADIQELPDIGCEIDREFVTGVSRINESAVICLDADKCISSLRNRGQVVSPFFEVKGGAAA